MLSTNFAVVLENTTCFYCFVFQLKTTKSLCYENLVTLSRKSFYISKRKQEKNMYTREKVYWKSVNK